MSNLVILNLSISNELDHKAMADVNGGTSPGLTLIRQIAAQKANESSKSSSSYPQDQDPQLGVSGQLSTFGWLQNQPFTPHS